MKQAGQQVIEIAETQKGPNGWAAAIIGGLIAAAGVILAVAIWQVSIGLSVGIAAAGIGIGAERLCYGLSVLVYKWQIGRAHLERARLEGGYRPPLLPPGEDYD